MTKILKSEAGIDPNAKPSTPEDYVKAVLSGEFTPQLRPDLEKLKAIPVEQRKLAAQNISSILGTLKKGSQGPKAPTPKMYGSKLK